MRHTTRGPHSSWRPSAHFALLLAGPHAAQAQEVEVFNEHRVQPEVWHFNRPADPGVDAYGDLSLSVPVMTVPGRGIDFPIAFSYRSGITVDQRPSWIGLGWNFDPGSITRSPEGGAYRLYQNAAGQSTWASYGVDVFDNPTGEANWPAAQPDVYSFTLPGRGSQAVTQSNSAAFSTAGATYPVYSEGDFVVGEHTPWKIEAIKDSVVSVTHETSGGSTKTIQTGTTNALGDHVNRIYAGARYYMPSLGRWTSVDPLAEGFPAWSPYNYVLNNPLAYTDPDGRSPVKGLKAVFNVAKRAYKASRRGESLTSLKTWKKAGVDEVMGIIDNVKTLVDGNLNADDAFAAIDLVTGFGGEAKQGAKALGLVGERPLCRRHGRKR